MESLGQYLRSVREAQNLTLEKVSSEIRISLEDLAAIENNQLSKIGNYGYCKVMVYSYSRFLGADEKIAMNLLDIIMPTQRQSSIVQQKQTKEKKVLISINFIWLITIILIVIVLGSIIWIAYSKGYLKRPFENLKGPRDSIRIEQPVVPEPEKPDTLRQRMLQVAQTSFMSNPVKGQENKITINNQKKAVADTTDYVNELIFNMQESPFNPRF
ncbi:MAG: helix-turn-helix transcriptional regulator [Candidatus Cloacimonadaceae bacterium]